MENWYVLQAAKKKEKEAAALLERSIAHTLWSECHILKKIKVFRSGGLLHLVDDVLFPGYLFIRTDSPGELARELEKSRQLPKLLSGGGKESGVQGGQRRRWQDGTCRDLIAAVDPADLHFLQTVCGENLQRTMGVTRLVLNEDNRIVQAEGVLSCYLDRIVKLNLHRRFALVEVPLFNRTQPILFGIRLEQDQAV